MIFACLLSILLTIALQMGLQNCCAMRKFRSVYFLGALEKPILRQLVGAKVAKFLVCAH